MDASYIDSLWDFMGSIYGRRWVSSYGPHDSNGVWLTTLRGFSHDVISEALQNTLTAYPDGPPTLGQFRALCRDIVKRKTIPMARRIDSPDTRGPSDEEAKDWKKAIDNVLNQRNKRRSKKNIESGAWTAEDEERFQIHARAAGLVVDLVETKK